MGIFNKNRTIQIGKHEAITCTKIFEFDTAHRVYDADNNKCEKLHGHRYKAELTFFSKTLENGMIIDFSIIKKRVKNWLDEYWDHNVILSKRDRKLAVAIEEATDQEVFLLEDNATTELMAQYLLNVCNEVLFSDTNVKCVKVRLYETNTSFAEYEIEI